jgi:dienelactone hydrolase
MALLSRWLTCGVVMGLGIGASAARAQARSDEWLRRPVDARTFQTFLSFFAFDPQVPFDVKDVVPEEVEGIPREHLSFQSTSGVRVTAFLYRTNASSGRPPGWIIFLHGGGGPGKDAAASRFFSTLLVRAGWNVLSLDMQYFGERKTELLTTFTEAEKHERLYNQPATYLAWVSQTVKDVGRGIDFLVKERKADPARIALVGFSRGAEVGVIIGGAEKRLSAVVLLYGGHLDGLETGHLPAACGANYIGHISPRPLLMVNGTQDADYNRETSVLPLQRLAKQPSEFRWADTGHQLPPAELLPGITRWLQEHVP